MNDINHGFSKIVFKDIEAFPIEILLGETTEVISKLQALVDEAKE